MNAVKEETVLRTLEFVDLQIKIASFKNLQMKHQRSPDR